MISDREMRAAKDYDIIRLARSMGLSPADRRGRTVKDTDETGLMYYPETNTFYNFYDSIGGDTITLVKLYRGLDFGGAVKYISELDGYMEGLEHEGQGRGRDTDRREEGSKDRDRENAAAAAEGKTTPGKSKETETKEFLLPEKNSDERRLYAYLSKTRCIGDDVIRRLLHEHLIYESADRHNAVFVCRDAEGVPRHAMLRGTVSGVKWRGDVYGGDKEHYGFSVPGSSDGLVLFEAPIDLMSYMTLNPGTGEHLLALGNVSGKCIDRYLAEHPGIKRIHMALDTDDRGYRGASELIHKYKTRGYECTFDGVYLYMQGAGAKDINEYLCMTSGKGKTDGLNKKREQGMTDDVGVAAKEAGHGRKRKGR